MRRLLIAGSISCFSLETWPQNMLGMSHPTAKRRRPWPRSSSMARQCLEQQKDPRRIWDDLEACNGDMEGEVRQFIQGWSDHINALY